MVELSRGRIASAFLGFALLAIPAGAMPGCGGGAEDDFPREAVSGSVTLDGAPLPRGVISFDPEGTVKDPVSVGGVIVDGRYSIDKVQGPTPGSYRVSIMASEESSAPASGEAPGAPPKPSKKAPKPLIPAKYNRSSELKAEVKAGESNTFDYQLESK